MGWVSRGLLAQSGWLALGSVAFAAELPVIDSIQGDRIVVIKTAKGNRVGMRGTEVNIGERIRTGPRASALILYPDGSKVIVGKNTELEIQASQGGTQWSRLTEGEVRGIIRKAPSGAAAGGRLPVQHRFGIRSKNAVMGVRGTDFVFALGEPGATAGSGGNASVHTLEGLVEVAKDEQALILGKGVPVGAGQYTTASPEAIQPVRNFDEIEFVGHLRSERPALLDLAKEPEPKGDPEAKTENERREREKVKPGDIEPIDSENYDKEGPRPPKPRMFRPWSFQFGPAFVKQENGGGSTYSASASWNPTLNFPVPVIRLGMRGHFSLTPLNSRTIEESKGDKFLAWEAGLLFTAKPNILPLSLEVGFGRSGWAAGHSKAGGLFMANIALSLGNLAVIDRVFVGIAHFDKPNPVGTDNSSHVRKATNTFKAGIGVQF